MIYVMSDIHGEYDKFIKMLDKINFSDDDELYVVGDVVDRGEKSIECLLYIMSKKNIHMLLGNHEEFMLDYFSRNKKIPDNYELYQQLNYETWFRNGGIETIKSFRNCRGNFILKDVLNYVESLPLVVDINVNGKNFYLAHANIEIENGRINSEQDRDFVLWERRMPSKNDLLSNDATLITGHTPTKHLGSYGRVYNNHDWYCVDCGATFYGILGCLRLDDMKEFYV